MSHVIQGLNERGLQRPQRGREALSALGFHNYFAAIE